MKSRSKEEEKELKEILDDIIMRLYNLKDYILLDSEKDDDLILEDIVDDIYKKIQLSKVLRDDQDILSDLSL